MVVTVIILAAVLLLVAFGCSSLEQKLLFYPTHRADSNGLIPWTGAVGTIMGYARSVERPKNAWLMLHGNAGQAADRVYALPSFSPDDAVFILEYPGYGARAGTPGRESFNAAAADAYRLLRTTFPMTPVCVVGESIGSGPACTLASLIPPPDKIVLIAPFAELSRVAREYFPSLLVRVALRSNWNNMEALAGFPGSVEIFAATNDTIIPAAHAKALAGASPGSKLIMIDGGHNEWAQPGRVRIRNP